MLPLAAKTLLLFASAARGDHGEALADWRNGTDPCSWTGVECAGAAVTALRLPRAGLRGWLAPELAELTSLRQM
jgi:phage-related protein